MTWIVGYNAIFGYAFLVSDIQVTAKLADGTEQYFDCCQKIYPLSEYIAGGFAGSVKIGFEMMGALHGILQNKPKDAVWCLDEIAASWLPEFMRKVYNSMTPQEQKGGCQIILASAHPQKNRGDAPWSMTQIAIFTAPDFTPVLEERFTVLSIGSGSKEYEDSLIEMSKNLDIMQAAMGGVGSYGTVVTQYIQNIFKRKPVAGVSPYYQMLSVERGGIYKQSTDYTTYHRDGRTEQHITPDVCTSYEMLLKHIKSAGIAQIQGIIA